MPLFQTRNLQQIAILIALFLTAACSPTYVSFEGPPNTVMFVDGKPHHLPSRIELFRPAGTGDANHYKVALVFNAPTGETRAEGQIDVFGYTESEADKLANNICKFDNAQLTNLANGTTLLYKAQTSSRQPLFDLTLNRK